MSEEPYKKEIVFEDLLPRWAYSDEEWIEITTIAEFMGVGGRYMDVENMPKPPPRLGFFDKK